MSKLHWVLVMLAGCVDYQDERFECGQSLTQSTATEPTANGFTPSQAVEAVDGISISVEFSDALAPLADTWSLDGDEVAAEGESITWDTDPACPAVPSVSVNAPASLSTGTRTASGKLRLEWFDYASPPESADGEPKFVGSIIPDTALEAWLRDQIRPVAADIDDAQLGGVGFVISLAVQTARLDATFTRSGVATNYPSEEISAFLASATVSP